MLFVAVRPHRATILIALLSVALVPAMADDEGDSLPTAPKPFDPRKAVAKVAEYQASHPEFAAGIATWFTAGLVLFVFGTALFLYSEGLAMLVVRDQDFRRRLLEQDYMEEGADIGNLNNEDNINLQVRPYVSLVGTLLIFVAIACMLYPLCDVITVLGLPAAPCILIVTFGSFFAAICVVTMWMFLIWMCTRTVAALVLLTISVSGQLLIPSGNPILVLLWMIWAFGGSWAYFFWLPSLYGDKPQDHPIWLQDIGNFQVSYHGTDIMTAFENKLNHEAKRFKPEESTLGAKGGEGKTV